MVDREPRVEEVEPRTLHLRVEQRWLALTWHQPESLGPHRVTRGVTRPVTRHQRAPGDKGGEAGVARRDQHLASEHRERGGGRLGGQLGQGLDSEHITGERLWSGHRGSVKPRRPPLRLRGAGRSGLRALVCAHICVSVETGLQILGSDSSSHVHRFSHCQSSKSRKIKSW